MPASNPPYPDIPVLETERLVMRGHQREDHAESAAMWADPIVLRHIGGTLRSPDESWWRLLGYVGQWSLFGYGFWVVREKASGRFVGEVGLGEFKRDVVPAPPESPEIGWVLASWSHGAGFATESVEAALDWADRELAADRTHCLIQSANHASLRVAEKCGYRVITPATYKDQPQLLLDRLRQP